MSIHADDEFNLRLALMSELDDVTPRDGLADVVIARYRKGRRRRFAGVFGLFVVFAGIGVPAGLAGSSGGAPARSGPVALRLGSYTLTLPAQYHPVDASAAGCAETQTAARAAAATAAIGQPRQEVAAAASGVCVLMFLSQGRGVPRRASQVTVGHYRAWLAPAGYTAAGDGTVLFVEAGESAGDLVISASGLSRPALVSLASAGLSAA